MQSKVVGGVGAGLGLTQGFVALALQLQDPSPNQGLAKGLWIGAAVTFAATLMYWFWPRKPADDDAPTVQTAAQSGSNNQLQQITAGRDAIAQQAERAIVVQAGGTYYETTEHKEDDRFVVNVQPERLAKFYEGNTSLQADLLFESFRGKWMRVRGPVQTVSASGPDWNMVSFQTGTYGVHITMFFTSDPWRQRLILLDRGDEIRAIGQIQRADTMQLTLDPCELE